MKKITIIFLVCLIMPIVFAQTVVPPEGYDSRCEYYCPDPDASSSDYWNISTTNRWCFQNGHSCEAASNYAGCEDIRHGSSGNRYWCSECRCEDVNDCDAPGRCANNQPLPTCSNVGKLDCNGVPTYKDPRFGGNGCPTGCEPGPSCDGICACSNAIEFAYCCQEIPIICGDGKCNLQEETCEFVDGEGKLCTTGDEGKTPTGEDTECRPLGHSKQCTTCGDGVWQKEMEVCDYACTEETCPNGGYNSNCKLDCTAECPIGSNFDSGYTKPTDSYLDDEITQGRKDTDDNGRDMDEILCERNININVDKTLNGERKTRIAYFEWNSEDDSNWLGNIENNYPVTEAKLSHSLSLAQTQYILQIYNDGQWQDVCKKDPKSIQDPNIPVCPSSPIDLREFIKTGIDARNVKIRYLTWRDNEPMPNLITGMWHTDVSCIKLKIVVNCGSPYTELYCTKLTMGGSACLERWASNMVCNFNNVGQSQGKVDELDLLSLTNKIGSTNNVDLAIYDMDSDRDIDNDDLEICTAFFVGNS